MPDFDAAAIVRGLIEEHQLLRSRIEEERKWWAEVREYGTPRFGEMGIRLAQLRRRIAAHFDHEESAAREASQRSLGNLTAQQVERLRDEHQSFLRQIDAMIGRTNDSGGSYECWGDLGLDFSEYILGLDLHESEELKVLGDYLGRLRPASYSGS